MKPVKSKGATGITREERRQDIMTAAAMLFARNGYSHTTVSEIVKAAGVAQGTFYLYFPSKQHVRLAIHDMTIDEVIRTIFPENEADRDPIARIEYGVRTAFALIEKDRDLIRAVHEDISLLCHEDEFQTKNQALLRPMTEFLRRGVEAGVFNVPSPEVTAYMLINLVENMALNSIFFNQPGSPAEVVALLVDFIKKALGCRLTK